MAAELKALELDKVSLCPAYPDRGVVLLAWYADNSSISIVDVPPYVYMHLVMFLA